MKLKKTILLMTALTAAALITSCTNDNDEATVNDGSVRFTAGIGAEAVATPTTRAIGDAWQIDDEIGVFMVPHGTIEAEDESTTNKKYTTPDGNGRFSADAANTLYYPMDNSAVDFIAYYPYRDGVFLTTTKSFVQVGTEQTDASQPGFDILWAKADKGGEGYKKSDADIPALSFGHCLAKLTMNCKVHLSAGEPSWLDKATVSINNMYTRANFDLRTGSVVRDTTAWMEPIIPRRLAAAPAGFHAAYDAIVLPLSYPVRHSDDPLTVTFTVGDETFTWNVGAMDFKPGHEYIYEVTITRTGVEATGTIEPWQEEKKDPVTAE